MIIRVEIGLGPCVQQLEYKKENLISLIGYRSLYIYIVLILPAGHRRVSFIFYGLVEGDIDFVKSSGGWVRSHIFYTNCAYGKKIIKKLINKSEINSRKSQGVGRLMMFIGMIE